MLSFRLYRSVGDRLTHNLYGTSYVVYALNVAGLKAGIHPKVVSERLGHANIGITLDIYSHVLPGMQEAAAEKFDRIFETDDNENSEPNVSKMLAKEDIKTGKGKKIGRNESEPSGARTLHNLIKRQRSSVPLSSLHSQGVPSRPDPKNHFVPDGTSSPVQSH